MNEIIRFQFSKGREVRYLSHLDLVRTMERTLRRARLPIAYSGGFRPRPIMSYSYALPVGILSEAEYADFEFETHVDPGHFQTIFNEHLPQGFKTVRAITLPSGSPALMRQINAALYRIILPRGCFPELTDRWRWLQSQDSFVVERQTKKAKREIDVLPLLLATPRINLSDQGTILECLCALGDTGNLKMEELGALLGFPFLEAEITRIEQFILAGRHRYSPLKN